MDHTIVGSCSVNVQKSSNELIPHTTKNVHVAPCNLCSLYRPLGHFDNITIVLHVYRSSASLTRAMILVVVHGPPSRNRAGNHAFWLISRMPAFLRERPAFLALFRNNKNCTNLTVRRHFVRKSSAPINVNDSVT